MNNQKNLVEKLDRFASKLEKPLEICVSIFLAVISIAIFILVFGRNVNIPVVWLGELSTYCAIWTTFFGFALAYRYDMFANIDIITRFVSPERKKVLELVWNVFAILFMVIVAWSSKDFILHVFKSGTKSPEMRAPLYIIYLGPIISYLITTFFGVVKLLKQLSGLNLISQKA